MTCPGPFENSEILAKWTAGILAQREVDSLVKWRMLEQWMQSEIFRGIEVDHTIPWTHLGEGEQPYWSNLPKKPHKPEGIPRIDLVFAHPYCEVPSKVIWLELKHIGRNQKNLKSNCRGLGPDLAALYAIDPVRTKELWLNPPLVVLNESKVGFWKEYGQALDVANHFYAQIVLVRRDVADVPGNEKLIREQWLSSFEKRAHVSADSVGIDISRCDTGKFSVFALVARVGVEGVPSGARPAAINRVARGNAVVDDAASRGGFRSVKTLRIERDSSEVGAPVRISFLADGHIVELQYKFRSGWNFEGYVLDGEFFAMPGRFETRKMAEAFYLEAAYQRTAV